MNILIDVDLTCSQSIGKLHLNNDCMHINYEIFLKNEQQGMLLLLREIAFYLLYSCRNSSNMYQRVLEKTGRN